MRLLKPEDILDTYGCEWVLQASNIDDEDKDMISFRLNEIKKLYIDIARERIRAEARFVGIELEDGFSFSKLRSEIAKRIEKVVTDKLMNPAKRVNLMAEIIKAHQSTGADMTGINLQRFGVMTEVPKPTVDVDAHWFIKNDDGSVHNNPKWAEIANAFAKIEEANSNSAIISSIDKLNQLQHNSFHILIDLQTGRMLNINGAHHADAVDRVKKVLDIKFNAKSPHDFIGEMSKDITNLMIKYRSATIQVK
jgi:hypothetical protein